MDRIDMRRADRLGEAVCEAGDLPRPMPADHEREDQRPDDGPEGKQRETGRG
jgi:hypothetical protein